MRMLRLRLTVLFIVMLFISYGSHLASAKQVADNQFMIAFTVPDNWSATNDFKTEVNPSSIRYSYNIPGEGLFIVTCSTQEGSEFSVEDWAEAMKATLLSESKNGVKVVSSGVRKYGENNFAYAVLSGKGTGTVFGEVKGKDDIRQRLALITNGPFVTQFIITVPAKSYIAINADFERLLNSVVLLADMRIQTPKIVLDMAGLVTYSANNPASAKFHSIVSSKLGTAIYRTNTIEGTTVNGLTEWKIPAKWFETADTVILTKQGGGYVAAIPLYILRAKPIEDNLIKINSNDPIVIASKDVCIAFADIVPTRATQPTAATSTSGSQYRLTITSAENPTSISYDATISSYSPRPSFIICHRE